MGKKKIKKWQGKIRKKVKENRNKKIIKVWPKKSI